jgi:hypothetical protein
MNQTVDLVVRGRGLNLFEELYGEVTILCFFPMPDDKRSLSASVKPAGSRPAFFWQLNPN